jgi:hypothetical protein
MGNSTTPLGSVVDYARAFPDNNPVLNAGGFSLQPALGIANDVMTEMLAEAFNWKFNRFKLPVFYTNSFQQDYALNVVNLGWLEHGFLVDINNTSTPKPIWPIETVRDLEATSMQYGRAGQACWLPNDQLTYGTWAASTTFSPLLNITVTPANPFLQIQDPNGNYWMLTTFGTTGASQPSWPASPSYPTYSAPTTTATTVTDGSVVWTAVNPKASGIRLSPIPPQAGVVFQVNLIGQMKPPTFLNFAQTLDPLTFEYDQLFKQGFITFCLLRSPEVKVRGKFQDAYKLWVAAMTAARGQADREKENAGFYPATPIMGTPTFEDPGPAWPFPLPT